MNRFVLATLMMTTAVGAAHAEDFGAAVDRMLAEKSTALFGFATPLAESAEASAEKGYRLPDDTPAQLERDEA